MTLRSFPLTHKQSNYFASILKKIPGEQVTEADKLKFLLHGYNLVTEGYTHGLQRLTYDQKHIIK